MMFSTTKLFVLAALFTSALGHAAVAITKEDAEKIQRSDVVRGDLDACPSYKGPGAGAVVRVSPQGTVTLFAHHFGNGKDGSTFFNAAFSVKSGEAGSFGSPVILLQNGELTPKENEGVVQLVVDIPAGRPCRNANCMLTLMSNGGFGNCIRVESEFENTPDPDEVDASSGDSTAAPAPTDDAPEPTDDAPASTDDAPASTDDAPPATAAPTSEAPEATNAPARPASKSAASKQCVRKPAPQARAVQRLHVRDWLLGRQRFARRA